jgi:hypothetical protein
MNPKTEFEVEGRPFYVTEEWERKG